MKKRTKKSLKSRLSRKQKKELAKAKTGQAPGTLTYTGEERQEKVLISSLLYNKDRCMEQKPRVDHKLKDLTHSDYFAWINVDGVHNPAVIKKVGDHFGLHPLVQEDIMSVDQRPKLEDYGDYMFCVLRMADLHKETQELTIEQVSLTIHKNCIISFQEDAEDIFDPIRLRIRQGLGKVTQMGPDYLAYLLLDTVVDHHFVILEHYGEMIDELEEELMENPKRETLKKVYELKQEISRLRKSVWPLREITAAIQKNINPLISEELNFYFRDLQDHILRVMESVESFRDTAAGMVDLYLSSTSHRMNDVMKVLTVISTIFIPLTFITGYYGMNLEGMKEDKWPWTYPIVGGVMVIMVVAQLIWYRRKGWL